MSRPCRYHRGIRKTLRARLGRAHNGRSVARATIRLIRTQCPDCLKESQ